MNRTSGRRNPTTFAEAFAKKRSKIADKLCLDRLLTALEDRQLLTKDQRQDLRDVTNVQQRAVSLMDELEKADDAKLPLFYEALVATNQRHVVDTILKRKTSEDEFVPNGSPHSSQEIETGDTRQEEASTSVMTEKRAAASVVDTTFRLKDLRKLMGKEYDTPSIKARMVSVSENMTPKKRNSCVKEYFEMRISDGETEARVVVYDKAHLLQSCKDLANADIVLEAGSYSVHRDYVGGGPSRHYIVLNSAPSLWLQ